MFDESMKKAAILIVDDKQDNVDLLVGLLEKSGFGRLKSTTDSRRVATLFTEFQPDLILLDLMMPHLDGFQVMELLRPRITPDEYLPILVLTADATPQTKLRALANGANDFLSKPFDVAEVTSRIKNLLETRRMHLQLHDMNEALDGKVRERTVELHRANTDLVAAYDATIEGWSRAMDLRDKETEGHSQRVTEMTERLAREVGMGDEEILNARRGALLHDLGKMGIPDSVLLKPGKLTDEEWVVMRTHPRLAYDLLRPIDYLHTSLDIPYCHHEKWDGSGYPRGLRGEEIPQSARLFAVVDVWDALKSNRPYRDGWPEERVLEHIEAGSGTHFDPDAAAVFLSVAGDRAHV